MARKANHIALELKAMDKKVDEFKEYLNSTKIKDISEYNERHQEIKIQLLIMKELGPIVQQIDILKKQADKDLESGSAQELRGDIPLSPLEEGII